MEIIEAINAQHSSQSNSIRQDREHFLNSQFLKPEFFSKASEIFSDSSVGDATIQGLILYIIARFKVVDFPHTNIQAILDCFSNLLVQDHISSKIKDNVAEVYRIISKEMSKWTFEYQITAKDLLRQFVLTASSHSWEQIDSKHQVSVIFASFFILKNYFQGLTEVSAVEVNVQNLEIYDDFGGDGDVLDSETMKEIYNFVVIQSVKVYALLIKDQNCDLTELWHCVIYLTQIIDLFLAFIDNNDMTSCIELVFSQESFQDIINQFSTVFSEKSALGEQNFLFASDISKVDLQINTLRFESMKSLYRLIKVTDSSMNMKQFKKTAKKDKFSKFLNETLQKIIKSLFVINSLPLNAIQHILQDDLKSEMVCLLLKMMKSLVKIDLLYDDFISQCIPIYFNCLLPLLVPTESDIELAESEPQEFVNLTQDLIENQKSSTPKSKAMDLVLIFSSQFGTLFTQIVRFSCEIFSAYGKPEVKDEECPGLKELRSFMSTSTLNLDAILDLALVQIAALVENVFKREDLEGDIVQTIQSSLESLTNSVQQTHLKSHLIFLLGQYSECFQTIDKSTVLEKIIVYLTQNLLYSNSATLMLSSIVNLKILLQKEQSDQEKRIQQGKTKNGDSVFIKIFRPYATEIAKTLLERCFLQFDDTDEVLNVFEEIIQLFSDFLAEEDEQLIVRMLEAFSSLYLSQRNSTDHKDEKTYKILSLVEQILSSEKLVLLLGDKIEVSIAPLLTDIANNPGIRFNQEILEIVATINQHRKAISEPVFNLFKILIEKNFFSQESGEFSELKFKYLNQIFSYAKVKVSSEIQTVSILLSQIIVAFRDLDMHRIGILVVIIESCGGQISASDYENIVDEVVDSDCVREFDVKQALKYLVILSGFIHFPQVMLEQLLEQGVRERVIANLITSSKLFSQEFSSKMYVMGLINLLRQTSIPEIKSRQIKLFEAILSNLQQTASFNPDLKVKDVSKEKQDFLQNYGIMSDFSDDDSSIDDIGGIYKKQGRYFDQDNEANEKEFLLNSENQVYGLLISLVKQADEFLVFRQFLESVVAANPNFINTLHNNLGSSYQTTFSNILKTKRVNFTQEDGTAACFPRKLLKIKRKIPN